jgi:Heparinase II/III-like protein/Heparinase II/III N-terminus
VSSLSWKLNRLRAMGCAEVFYRFRHALRAKLEEKGYGLADASIPAEKLEVKYKSFSYAFDQDLYRNAADKILAGRYDIFSLHDIELGFPPQWNRDCRTGTLAPLIFGKTLNYRDEEIVGDIKYLWEPNRHLELVTLAQAYHLTTDLRYAIGIRSLLLSWFGQCPYPLGPNWSSSLEHAVRLVNWAYVWLLLGGESSPLFFEAEGNSFRGKWLQVIYQHCYFISKHFSKFSSANNHLLGEYMGLFVASVTWPLWSESAGWQSLAYKGFVSESLIQNFADGVNREQAVWYHHEVADMMILCAVLGQENAVTFPAEFWSRLESMLEYISSLMDVGGNMPAFGDSDDATMVRFCPKSDFNVFKSLLATGALLFKRRDFKEKAGPLDDKSRWLLGDQIVADYENLAGPYVSPIRCDYPLGGYYVMGSKFDCLDEIRIVVDCAPLGYLSIAAHGHADALSFTLSVAGLEILIDPGTYAYHTQKLWRDYFRSTRAHNTVCVDSLDQSVITGNFMWSKHAEANLELWESTADFDKLVGRHTGYLRLDDPVLHRREIMYFKESHELVIKDYLECTQRHFIELHWHCHEKANVSLLNGDVQIIRDQVKVSVCLPDPRFTARLARGEESPPLGWSSRKFDSKEPITTIVWFGYIENNSCLETRLLIN